MFLLCIYATSYNVTSNKAQMYLGSSHGFAHTDLVVDYCLG
jgi:hypothetical protein